MIGVDAHQRRHVERRRQSCLSFVDQIVKALVGLFCGAKASELSHRPRSSAVHRRIWTASVRWFAGKAEVLFEIKIGDIVRRIEPIDLVVRDRCEPVLPFATLW